MNRKKQFCCHQTRFLGFKWATNAFAAGAVPQTQLGELTTLLRPLSYIKSPTSKRREREMEREGKARGRREWGMPHVCRGIKGPGMGKREEQ